MRYTMHHFKRLWRCQRFRRFAGNLVLLTFALFLLSTSSSLAQIGLSPGPDNVGLPGTGGMALLDDTNLAEPRRPELLPGPRFQIVTAGPHVILLDSHLGNTWLLRSSEADKDDRPEWILIFREVLDDERRPPMPACEVAPETDDDPLADDPDDDHFDPFGP